MIMGFDLVFYDQTVEYMMELCEEFNPLTSDYEITYQDLKTALAFMHSFRITHSDIKKDNVMYSPSREKLVFIDFNCSSAVKEKPGFKTLTKFIGTPGWCSN